MEEHNYGGGDLPACSRAAAAVPTRPNGWSSLTKLLRNSSPPHRDPFPPLLAAPATGSSASGPKAGAENRRHAAKIDVAPASSGGGGERPLPQQQRGVACHSPASSAGSFSSNNSGRHNQRNHDHTQAETQAALSSTATTAGPAAAAAAQGFLVGGGGSPPESSSGSVAPNSFLDNNHHPKRNRLRWDHHLSGGGSAGPTSSAGSFSLNPNPFRVQSGAYDALQGGGGGGFQHRNGREGKVTGAENIPYDEDRRDETSAAERDSLGVRPTISDGRSSIGDVDRDVNNGAHEQQGKDAGDSTAASSAFHVPKEPEWEEEDLYLRIRSDALKEGRARDKFARGASQAYLRGDHRMAKILSKQAEEKRVLAEKLHAKAATEILNQRSKQGSFDIWHLDLHGLHSSEAVAALESRLTLLEHRLAEDHQVGAGSSTGPLERGGHDENVLPDRSQQLHAKQILLESFTPTSKLLSIITGVGAHSQGGPTLPSAVKSYLIDNGYHLEEPRAGVIGVRPKLRFSAR